MRKLSSLFFCCLVNALSFRSWFFDEYANPAPFTQTQTRTHTYKHRHIHTLVSSHKFYFIFMVERNCSIGFQQQKSTFRERFFFLLKYAIIDWKIGINEEKSGGIEHTQSVDTEAIELLRNTQNMLQKSLINIQQIRFDFRIKLEIKIVIANEQTNSAIHNKAIKWNYKSFMLFYRPICSFTCIALCGCVNWIFTKQLKSFLFFSSFVNRFFFSRLLYIFVCLPPPSPHTHEARDKIPFANIS